MSFNKISKKPFRLNGQSNTSITIASQPDECPICHNKIVPQFRTSCFIETNNFVECAFQCTNEKCQKLFIAEYYRSNSDGYYYVKNTKPKTIQELSFPEEIRKISPAFIEIMNQVNCAEVNELKQIVGIGLRKAIEFLVKDFVISQKPEEIENIKKIFLGQCIENYIEDINIKNCIKRATWLGNDETHYLRKWESHDISDLKVLIRLSINWIENVILTKKYIEDMK